MASPHNPVRTAPKMPRPITTTEAKRGLFSLLSFSVSLFLSLSLSPNISISLPSSLSLIPGFIHSLNGQVQIGGEHSCSGLTIKKKNPPRENDSRLRGLFFPLTFQAGSKYVGDRRKKIVFALAWADKKEKKKSPAAKTHFLSFNSAQREREKLFA